VSFGDSFNGSILTAYKYIVMNGFLDQFVEDLTPHLRKFLLDGVEWTYGLNVESRLLTAGGLGMLHKYDPEVEGRISNLFQEGSHQ
jgi:hypothetical protein